MNLLSRYALSLGLVALIGCGDSPQFVIAEHEGCSLDGPERVRRGIYEFVVSGDALVAAYRLGDDTSVEDVEAHMAAFASGVTPHGATRVLRIRNEPGLQRDRSAQNSTSRRFSLRPGLYLFACDWEAGDLSGRTVVGDVEVVP